MLTVPKVIASGESVTIPAGRVAVLPDLQVDGDLVVDGDLFIPTGSMTSKVVQKVASTDNAVVRFDGTTGQVQNSSVIIDDNGNVGIGNTSDNSTRRLGFITGGGGSSAIESVTIGATDQALVFKTTYATESEKMRLTGQGSLGIGTASPTYNLDIRNTQTTGTPTDNAILQLKSSNRNAALIFDTIGGSHSGGLSNYVNGVIKSQLLMNSSGDILSILPNGGLGYGTGSGGTVTQLTSKSTAVTLNKPTGQITMNNTALAQNVKVSFLLYNSIIGPYDNIHITIVSGSTVLAQYEARGRCSGGVAEIVVSHTYGGTLGEPIILTFTVLKGAMA